MAEVTVSEKVPIGREEAWALISDLSRLGEWLTLHEGWRSEVPERLAAGTELTSVVSFKGMRNRITWTITEFDPPGTIALQGDGKGGTKAALRLRAHADGSGSRVELETEFSNPALIGPIGGMAGRSLKGELRKSIKRLVELAR